MLAVATSAAISIPIWTFFTFIMASQMGLYGLFVRSLLASRREKKKNGNGCKTTIAPATPPHEHEYVTVQMCDQTQQVVRAEMKIVVVEISHVKEIVTRFENAHKDEHSTMVTHFDRSMEQIKELIEKNNS